MSADSLVGRVVGAYRIERSIGQGGMGAVYVGRHARTGRSYAVKVLLPEHASRKDALARFRREAEALGAVGHAHIVAIHDYDETPDGLWFLVMDLLEGEDLAHRLHRSGPMPWRDAVALLDPIVSAIDAAHRAGLVHRDLKPSNVFLARAPGAAREVPMLLDFGLARALEPEGEQNKVTATGTVMGTPNYMSPEQAQGTALDGRSDQWALAILLHEMIAGRPPFVGPTLTSTLVAVMTAPRPRLSDAGIAVPEGLEQVLDRALAKAPADRFADVASFRAALAQITGVTLPGAPMSMPSERLPATMGIPLATAPTAAVASLAPSVPTLPMAGATPAPPVRVPWMAAVIAAGAVLSIGLVALAASFAIRDRGVEPIAAPAAPIAAPPVAHPPVAEVAPVAPPPEPAVTPPPAEVPAAVTRRRVRAHGDAAPTEEPVEAAAPVPPSEPTTTGAAAGPPPALVRATERMAESDFDGCLRELEHAGTSAPILGARMNCALRTGRRSDLVAACDLLHRHHPSHAYTRTCDTMLSVTP